MLHQLKVTSIKISPAADSYQAVSYLIQSVIHNAAFKWITRRRHISVRDSKHSQNRKGNAETD